MSEVGGRALSLIDRVEPPLVRTMSNFQLASGQATLLVEEVRAAPWRLLERPDEKEQREVVLFSAVRRYAESVEKLRDATEFGLGSVSINTANADALDAAQGLAHKVRLQY